METLKKIKKWIVFEYNSIHNSISFWYNKRQADKMHKLTGKRYHVVPKDESTCMVVDNTYIDHYNRAMKKVGGRKISIVELLRMSYYSTSVNSLQREDVK